MSARRSRRATGEWRVVVPVLLFGAMLAGCTTSSDNSFGLTNPSFTAAGAAVAAGEGAVQPVADGVVPEPAMAAATDSVPAAVAGDVDTTDAPLPAQVAFVPSANPTGGSEFPPVPAAMADAGAAANAAAAEAPVAAEATADAAKPSGMGEQVASAAPAVANEPQFFLTATEPAPVAPPKKRGFLSNLFSTSEPAPIKSNALARKVAAPAKPAEPLVQLASVGPDERLIPAAAFAGDDTALPGVRKTALFEIRRKSGLDDDSDVDLHEDEEIDGSYRVASAAGLARLAPNGLLTQTENVDVSCLKPSLVRTLKAVERHYGRKMTVTSGYRDSARNRRARGAKNSLHMYCAAADVQVPGVSKWELAAFVRSMPGRGGVGTYCHTESVHIDVGPERDWNWRCRGKRKKRR